MSTMYSNSALKISRVGLQGCISDLKDLIAQLFILHAGQYNIALELKTAGWELRRTLRSLETQLNRETYHGMRGRKTAEMSDTSRWSWLCAVNEKPIDTHQLLNGSSQQVLSILAQIS